MKLLLHNKSKKVRLNSPKAVVAELDQEKIVYYIHRGGIKIPVSKTKYESWPWKHRSISYEITAD